MDGLISKCDALDAVASLYWVDERLLRFRKYIDDVYWEIRELPEQPERKKGHWVYNSYGNGLGNWHCSVCEKIALVNGDEGYCPHCGAEMKGEDDDT